ncbi:MAG: DUF2089 domain-containing protein [Spirochaetes bacterium]|nr:DUF2089 domain-containing protein [Spirochaetota bacterium]
MIKKILTKCPICGDKMVVTSLKCLSCNVEISGNFELDDFFKLNNEQLSFLKSFIRNRGSIKDVEKELGISYPTVRNRLDEIIETLGYKVERDRNYEKKKNEILQKLENGEITSNEAIKMLKELEQI